MIEYPEACFTLSSHSPDVLWHGVSKQCVQLSPHWCRHAGGDGVKGSKRTAHLAACGGGGSLPGMAWPGLPMTALTAGARSWQSLWSAQMWLHACRPLMEAHAHAICSSGGDVLNVGFGLGLVDEAGNSP